MSDGRKFRRDVARRARGLCEYCKTPRSYCPDPYVVEHIQPQAAGGLTELENLAWSCNGCNSHKGTSTEGRDNILKEFVTLFHPRRDRWGDHFRWSEDQTEVVPLTAIGRVTIARLRLNREELRNLRRMLTKYGEHPPRS